MSHPLARPNFHCSSGLRCRVGAKTYVLAGKLGDGAVGMVRKATRSSDNALVAIKFLAPDPKYIEETKFDDVASRFRHEGERGAKLNHPRLVKILECVENEGGTCFQSEGPTNPFMVMELMSGRTLESEIKATDTEKVGRLEINRERLFLAIQLIDAVKYVHTHRLVHRDIKPANIFLSDKITRHKFPRLKLGDFGVVKWGDFHQAVATGNLTMTGQQGLGTLKYMSPEQAIKPKEVTPKSDVFSLGITLYELFTGQILASPHHVYQLMSARMSKGRIFTRFMELWHNINESHDHFLAKLLDCFLRGTDGRPKADDLYGCLTSIMSREHEIDCKVELS
jgi:eukaryotic-like serine/threonine-protein kinase